MRRSKACPIKLIPPQTQHLLTTKTPSFYGRTGTRTFNLYKSSRQIPLFFKLLFIRTERRTTLPRHASTITAEVLKNYFKQMKSKYHTFPTNNFIMKNQSTAENVGVPVSINYNCVLANICINFATVHELCGTFSKINEIHFLNQGKSVVF